MATTHLARRAGRSGQVSGAVGVCKLRKLSSFAAATADADQNAQIRIADIERRCKLCHQPLVAAAYLAGCFAAAAAAADDDDHLRAARAKRVRFSSLQRRSVIDLAAASQPTNYDADDDDDDDLRREVSST